MCDWNNSYNYEKLLINNNDNLMRKEVYKIFNHMISAVEYSMDIMLLWYDDITILIDILIITETIYPI